MPKKILEIPKYGCINIHASLLPKYRGASPIHQAILNGDKETGVTIILMDEKMDQGKIVQMSPNRNQRFLTGQAKFPEGQAPKGEPTGQAYGASKTQKYIVKFSIG